MNMLTVPFFSIGLVLLSGVMGMLLMWLQKRPQPQAALIPARVKKIDRRYLENLPIA